MGMKLEPSSLLNNYKARVLKLLKNKYQSNRLTCGLRMALFAVAAQDPNRQSTLVPFPPCFLNAKTKFMDYDEVTKAISEIPGFMDITDSTDLPELTWELLDWVLNHNTTVIEPWVKDIPANVEKLKLMTGLANLPVPDNIDVYLLKITHTQPKPQFNEAKKKFGSKFAFHGSRRNNFHSILHRGLMCSFNRRSVLGHGTYMSPRVEVSRGYSYYYSSQGQGWAHSIFGNTFRCNAIVEFAMSPDTKDFSQFGCYVCDNDDHMQLSHLILYRE